jgi:hypothetical protein
MHYWMMTKKTVWQIRYATLEVPNWAGFSTPVTEPPARKSAKTRKIVCFLVTVGKMTPGLMDTSADCRRWRSVPTSNFASL